MEIKPFKIESIQDPIDKAADFESLCEGERNFLLLTMACLLSDMEGPESAVLIHNLAKLNLVVESLSIKDKRKGALVEYFVSRRNGNDLLDFDEDEDDPPITVTPNGKGVEIGFKTPPGLGIEGIEDEEVMDEIMSMAHEVLVDAIGEQQARKAEIVIDKEKSKPGLIVMKVVRGRHAKDGPDPEPAAVKH